MLRWACPCAECRGEGYGTVGRLEKVTELPQPDLELEAVTLVGRYALQLGFRSGHSTGIYSFRYLRSICPSRSLSPPSPSPSPRRVRTGRRPHRKNDILTIK
jgi:DUF971 family protein